MFQQMGKSAEKGSFLLPANSAPTADPHPFKFDSGVGADGPGAATSPRKFYGQSDPAASVFEHYADSPQSAPTLETASTKPVEGAECARSASPVPASTPAAPGKVTPEQLQEARGSCTKLTARLNAWPLTDVQRESIRDRVTRLTDESFVREMSIIEHAMGTKNAERALVTYADLSKTIKDDKTQKAQERLTPEVVGMLVTGVADSRTAGKHGQAGILGSSQARDASLALTQMTQEDYAKTMAVLGATDKPTSVEPVPGADPAAERSLILKAVAARRDEYALSPWEADPLLSLCLPMLGIVPRRELATEEITKFGDAIRAVDRKALITSTSLIDVDEVNSVKTNPNRGWEHDENPHNDGVSQRFGSSCAIALAQIIRGEADPIYALAFHNKDGIQNPAPDTQPAEEQKNMLERFGGAAVSRLGEWVEELLCGPNEHHVEISQKRKEACRQFYECFLDSSKDASPACMGVTHQQRLDKVLSLYYEETRQNDFPPKNSLKYIMPNYDQQTHSKRVKRKDIGVPLAEPLVAFNQGVTHIDYQDVAIDDSNIAQKLHIAEKALRKGQIVPFRSYGAQERDSHFMLLSDARPGEDGTMEYLMSDPWGGETRWIPRRDLIAGTFRTKDFGASKCTEEEKKSQPKAHDSARPDHPEALPSDYTSGQPMAPACTRKMQVMFVDRELAEQRVS